MGEEPGEDARQAPQDRGEEDQQHAAPARDFSPGTGSVSSSIGVEGENRRFGPKGNPPSGTVVGQLD